MTAAPIDGLADLADSACAGLRARFAAVGFTPDLVAQADLFVPGLLIGPRLPLLRWWLGRRTEPGAALARLFVFHDRLTASEAGAALGGELLDRLIHAGVVAAGPGGVLEARFLISPVEGGMWLLSDSLASGPDAVMGPSRGTQHLGRLVPPAFAGTALDVGCGAGSLALVAARSGARHAVGVDVNPRAIEIARFNARLNAVPADFRTGDVIEPVAGERFDLVLSQPPFVIRPPGLPEVAYLHGGPTGDELPRRFVGAIARVLGPGGRALVLMQSAERDGDPLAARIRAAVADAAVDVLVIGSQAPPPAVQASVLASYDDPSLGDHYAMSVRRYLDHFAALGMTGFIGALVVLGRPPDSTRREGRYTLGLTLSHQHYDAASLEQFLRGLDLIGLPPEVFERTTLRLSPHARLMTETSGVEAAGQGAGQGPGGEQTILRIEAPGIGTDWPTTHAELQILDAIADADSLIAATEASARARRVPAATLRQDVLALAGKALIRGALVRADGP